MAWCCYLISVTAEAAILTFPVLGCLILMFFFALLGRAYDSFLLLIVTAWGSLSSSYGAAPLLQLPLVLPLSFSPSTGSCTVISLYS
jgi:hypothetical protein